MAEIAPGMCRNDEQSAVLCEIVNENGEHSLRAVLARTDLFQRRVYDDRQILRRVHAIEIVHKTLLCVHFYILPLVLLHQIFYLYVLYRKIAPPSMGSGKNV